MASGYSDLNSCGESLTKCSGLVTTLVY